LAKSKGSPTAINQGIPLGCLSNSNCRGALVLLRSIAKRCRRHRYKARRLKKIHGAYPAQLEDAGVIVDEKRLPLHIGYLLGNGSEPMLPYASTFAIFDQYFYEFEKGRWVYMAD
jgi:hypothetical protein